MLGTGTKKDTVNAALAQVVALNARRQFLDDARRGDLTDAAEEQLMDQAWRR
ncbi:MAG: type II toxin-antitoxin system VapB family antitoxin [Actinomycetota bacterium]|nr:type II toxin-antitoxin system VapB family antitoxin [Actinomycetota bacterium]